MVGGKNALFAVEGFSKMNAGSVVRNVWSTGQKLGYNQFVNYVRGSIIDDHTYVTTDLGVPTIDIINYDVNTDGFGGFWHTHDDDMENIDPNTLKAVGQTVTHVIYNERP